MNIPPSNLLCTSISELGSIRPALGLTQYCLGAVVLTLKMTGWFPGFFTRSDSLEIRVKGPDIHTINTLLPLIHLFSIQLTMEFQLLSRFNDNRHFFQ